MSAFPSHRLRSSTFDITGLLAGVGRRLPYAYRVSRTIDLAPGLSYPHVRAPARAGVMCVSVTPRLCEVYTVFHITYNLSEFTLYSRTMYQHYARAIKSNIVPVGRLIPRSFTTYSSTYVRAKDCSLSKRFHKACVTLSKVHWYNHNDEICRSKDETIARLYIDNNEWWCDKSYKPLFLTAGCLFC